MLRGGEDVKRPVKIISHPEHGKRRSQMLSLLTISVKKGAANLTLSPESENPQTQNRGAGATRLLFPRFHLWGNPLSGHKNVFRASIAHPTGMSRARPSKAWDEVAANS